MEQRFIRISLIITSIVALNACQKALEEPETVDPIYQDLRSDQARAEKSIEEKKKELEGVQSSLEKTDTDVSTAVRKHTQQQIFLIQKTIALMNQDAAYFKLRAETRKAVDRDTYPAIYAKKGKWPDAEEFEHYMAEKRLREVSRNWNDRVPKPINAPTKESSTGEAKAVKSTGESEGREKKE